MLKNWAFMKYINFPLSDSHRYTYASDRSLIYRESFLPHTNFEWNSNLLLVLSSFHMKFTWQENHMNFFCSRLKNMYLIENAQYMYLKYESHLTFIQVLLKWKFGVKFKGGTTVCKNGLFQISNSHGAVYFFFF